MLYAASAGASGNGIVKRFDGATGNAEYILDAHLFQIGYQYVGYVQLQIRNVFWTSYGCFRVAVDMQIAYAHAGLLLSDVARINLSADGYRHYRSAADFSVRYYSSIIFCAA
jgi:hypothetical protein